MATRRSLKAEDLSNEFDFTTSASSGPGGQNVNKVNTKVTLRFDVAQSALLSDEEKHLLLKKLSSRLTKDGILILRVQEKRSQLQNKKAAISKLEKLINKALTKKKVRKPTKPPKGAVQKRLNCKKQQAEKKKWRQKL